MVSGTQLKLIAAGATTALAAASLVWQKHERRGRGLLFRPADDSLVAAARTLNRGAGLLALAVGMDSAAEHYRGDFQNRAMYTPLAVSALSLLASSQGQQDPDPASSRLRNGVYLGTVLTGLAGTGFHLYNVTKRPGGFCWSNLFYAAPLGAPSALVLSGVLGYYAERLRAETDDAIPQVFGLPAGKAVALMAAAGLLGTTAEAGLLHFRGSFQNPAMYLPVTAPPIAAGLLVATALAGPQHPRLRWWSRLTLRFTTFMGLAGAGFHTLGIARNFGGWRNWRQNLQAGPPLPAPPSFTGLALAGLAAHTLLDEERDLSEYRWWDK
ncbi:sodium/proton-translocating pyrophosphatase [Pseudomonas sp. SST3]|uniref:sodium/proton-translocating pyrophosphatase n=1 Tax=Pseudomonas sp. SST3 TaxID=2267882 RepID=UPI000DFCB87E|nr:sodium/proton-translocating pyrophosphatase [Pseudomonas sp. SST3]NKQ10097.1 sodium/proton-translocating pyrophosphatase [Pseudomonas sp. SST3]